MPEQKEYDVFLSYSTKDSAWASEFADALSQAGLHGWFDVAALPPGERRQEKIQAALRASKTLVLILSPQSVESPWTFFQLGAALADQKRIIPVVTGDVELTKMPMLLRQFQFLKESSPRQAGIRVAEAIAAKQ